MAAFMEVEHRIRQLPQGVVNKIAAGEVIERAASVVKELMENSVDALASRIDVEIEQGGSELIRIVDTGEGIHPDDIELSVSAHATSKLRDADDLFRVRTRGFRGEALASIAEVSRFRLRSRQATQLTGMELEVDGGIVKEPRACGCPVGTQIEVRQLFLNTPVRRKFMKTPATEFAHIAEQFTRIALACPNLHLTLKHNGRLVYELPATHSLLERLTLFHGNELGDKLIPIEATHGEARLWGYVAHPSISKGTRKGQYLFLNGRWIQDRSLQHALGEGYRGILMTGRYPVAFLFLEIPPEQVDVNVHPTKSEVRFLDSAQLYRLMLSTLRTKFLGMDLGSKFRLNPTIDDSDPDSPVSVSGRLSDEPGRLQKQMDVQQQLKSWATQQIAGWKPQEDVSDLEAKMDQITSLEAGRAGLPVPKLESGASSLDGYPSAQSEGFSRWPTSSSSGIPFGSTSLGHRFDPTVNEAMEHSEADPVMDGVVARQDAGEVWRDDVAHQSEGATVGPPIGYGSAIESRAGGIVHVPMAEGAERPTSATAELRAMQVHDCYIVVETGDGLTVIDQHALHERIMYEYLRNRVLAGTVEIQRLLMPVPLEMTAREAGLLLDQVDLLKELGLLVEEFGGNTIALSGYPIMLRKADPVDLLRGIVEQLESSGQKVSRRDLLDSLLHMMSCKSAIKAGQRLTPEEMSALLAQRHLVDDAHHCPHGRPTALMLSRQELDRQFGRLG
ncbi:MAG: DNA mismatch repair endonuclease MutL [Planctomycetaceae bacterium]